MRAHPECYFAQYKRCPKWKYQLLNLTEQLLASLAPEYFVVSPVSQYQNTDKGLNSPNNAMDVDRLDHLASKFGSEVNVPLSQFPLHLRGQVRAISRTASEEDQPVDLVYLIKKILLDEFGGISL